ncbi:hypothetical protein FRC91_01420 [Bradymonadales bacterium TMQ1]|nr:hypothetical protein FRC91_01420 [Bradymonadales bacterium TMQ1]
MSPIQLVGTSLRELCFRFSEDREAFEQRELDYRLSLQGGVGIDEHDPNEAIITFKVEVEWEEGAGPFELRIEYAAIARQDGSLSREMFEKQCRLTIMSVVLSYMRPMISRLMEEAGESFRLPLIDLRQLASKTTHGETK